MNRADAARLPNPVAGYEDWPAWARDRPRYRPDHELGVGLAEVLGVPQLDATPAVTEVDGPRTVDGVRIQAVEWQLAYGPPTRAWLLQPDGEHGPLPGALALHCHGGVKSIGAAQLVPHDSATVGRMRAAYYGDRAPALELARRGFVVLAHDTFAWGSRRFPLTEHTPKLAGELAGTEALWREAGVSPDADARYDAAAAAHEDSLAKAAGVLGTSFAGMVMADDLVALEVLATRSEVDASRLGCFGFSGGGGRSLLLAALDRRIRAHVVTCMMATFESLTPLYLDTHSWLLNSPGLWRFRDWPELLELDGERRVLVQYGREDALFPLDGMVAADAGLRARLGEERYRAEFAEVGHVFDAALQDSAFAFLQESLSDGAAADR